MRQRTGVVIGALALLMNMLFARPVAALTVTATVSTGGYPVAVAVNPVTNRIYVANSGSDNVTMLTEQQAQAIPRSAGITPLAGNMTDVLTPTFSFTASNSMTDVTVDNFFYQMHTWEGPWMAGANQGAGAFSGPASAPQPGFHILFAYAADGEEATSTVTGWQSSPLIGTIITYGFLVAPPLANVSLTSLNFGNQPEGGTTSAQTFTLSNEGGSPLHFSLGFSGTNAGDFAELMTDTCSTLSGHLAPSSYCTISVTFKPETAGAESATLTVTDNSNGIAGSTQTVSLTGTGTVPVASVLPGSLTFGNQNVGTTSASQPVTLSNAGNVRQTVGGLEEFSLAAATGSPTSATVAPGQAATYNLSVTGTPGAYETVTLTCNGAPPEATCTLSPGSVHLVGTTSQPTTVSVTTTAPAVADPPRISLPPMGDGEWRVAPALLALATLLGFAWAGQRRVVPLARPRPSVVSLGGLLVLALSLAACGGRGGGGGRTDPGTPAGTYTLTVTGTTGSGSATLTHSVTVTLQVT